MAAFTTAITSSHSPSIVVNIAVVSLGSPEARTTSTAAATARWYEPGSSTSTEGSEGGPEGAIEKATSMRPVWPGRLGAADTAALAAGHRASRRARQNGGVTAATDTDRADRPADRRPARDPDGGRALLGRAGRVVVKIGSSSLTRADGRLNVPALRKLVDVLAEVVARGTQVVLVTSGSISAGFQPLGLAERPTDVATKQAAAAVGQTALMATYTDAFGAYDITCGQILMTASDTVHRARYRHALQAFERLLELGAVPIVNENDALATSEIRFGDNDRLAALVAQLVQADALVLLTDVDGLYDAPPSQPGARRIPLVRELAEVAGVEVTARGSAFGTGGMITKLQSAEMATLTGIPVMLTSAANIGAAFAGDDVGTWFEADSVRTNRRKVWLEHAAAMHGRLVVDEGAAKALRERARRCSPRASAGRRGSSSPATRSRSSTSAASRSPTASRRTTRASSRRCSGTRATSCASSSPTAASGRSCTATTWCSCAARSAIAPAASGSPAPGCASPTDPGAAR